MTQTEYPGDPLTLEQWRSVQDMIASLTAAQASWFSGYFTRLDVGSRVPLPQPASSEIRSGQSLAKLFETGTGHSAELASDAK